MRGGAMRSCLLLLLPSVAEGFGSLQYLRSGNGQFPGGDPRGERRRSMSSCLV